MTCEEGRVFVVVLFVFCFALYQSSSVINTKKASKF